MVDVVESIEIAAAPATAWAAISDPSQYGRWSPEATGARRSGSSGGTWAVGDTFTGTNRLWVPWSTQCRVVDVQVERRFAFDVRLGPFPIAEWAYTLETVAAGTRVTETWADRRTGLRGAIARPAGLAVGRGYDAAARNRVTMRATLAALKADLEGTG